MGDGPALGSALHGMTAPIVITGASGNVGRAVVTALRARGLPARPALREPVGDAVRLDFLRPETFEPALAGAGGLFLLRPPPIADVQATLNRLVDVALAMGVSRVVFLSVIGADTRGYIPHAKVEKHLSRSAAEWTFLRAGFFAQNLGDAYRADICEHDELFVPAGAGRAAFIDVRDLGEVAARCFAEAGHAGRAYTLTGPEALGFTEVAALLSAALGREIRYTRPGVLRYMARLRRRGLPFAQRVVQTVLHVGLRFGQGEGLDPTLARLLERPPRTLARYIADHVELWR
jgi:uncharacterized protein YbjT (DUF2867 family)